MTFWLKVWGFVKDKKIVWFGVGAIALFAAGLLIGRYLTPPQTIVTEKVKTVEVDKVVVQTKTEVQVVRIKDSQQQQRIHRTVVEGIDPPGCRSKTTTEDINVDSVVHDNTNTNSVEVKYVDRVVEKWQDRVVEKKVLKPADWRIYAGVGLSIPHYLGQGDLGVPNMKGVVVNAGIDRRVVGPFWLGLQGNTQGTVGLNLSAVW